jgi:hypothetical protein
MKENGCKPVCVSVMFCIYILLSSAMSSIKGAFYLLMITPLSF